jgi:hypothetical protein
MSETSDQAARRGALVHRKIVTRKKKKDNGGLKHVSIGPLPAEFMNVSSQIRNFLLQKRWGRADIPKESHSFRVLPVRPTHATIADMRNVDAKCREMLATLCVQGRQKVWEHYIPLRMKNVSKAELVFSAGTLLYRPQNIVANNVEYTPTFESQWHYDKKRKTLTLSRMAQSAMSAFSPSPLYVVLDDVNDVRIAPGETFKIDLSVPYGAYLEAQNNLESPWHTDLNTVTANVPAPRMFLEFEVPGNVQLRAGSPISNNNNNNNNTEATAPATVRFFLLLDAVEVTYARQTKHRIPVADNRVRVVVMDGEDDTAQYHYDSDLDAVEHLDL